MNRKLIERRDWLIIAAILILAAVAYVLITDASYEPIYARISVRNHPDIHLRLSENTEFILPQNPNVRFKIENGAAAFIASDCPDQVCVHMGFLSRPGQSAACLPNFVSLVIIGDTGDEALDIMTNLFDSFHRLL